MNTYIIDSPKYGCEITFKFNLNGVLCAFEIEQGANLSLEQTHAFTNSVRLVEKELLAHLKMHNVKYQFIPADISFDRFWNTYDYKLGGSKTLTNKKFDKLSDYDKAAAIDYINKYKQIKRQQNTSLQYAVTYINQRIWDN